MIIWLKKNYRHQYDSCMEAIIPKNASEIAGDAIDAFKEIRRKRKAERAEEKRQSQADFTRAGIAALIATVLFATYLIQRIFFSA